MWALLRKCLRPLHPGRLLGSSALLLLLCLNGNAQQPKAHPVAISEKDAASSETCLGCHAAIVKTKFVHSAVKEAGCAACHDVKSDGTKTTVSLVAEGNELCLVCHDDKRANEASGRIHPPTVKNACTTCHNPHGSAQTNSLLLPMTGKDAKENLCLTCHGTIGNLAKAKFAHAALDPGCDTCHVVHKSKKEAGQQFAFHLSKDSPTLCADCHDLTDKRLREAHLEQPFETARCTECHNPHGAEGAKLISQIAHPPFADKQCDTCHLAAEAGKVKLLEEGKAALCYLCHDAVQKKIQSAKFPHGLFAGEDRCTGCHSPHDAAQPKLLRQPQVELCLACHDDRAQEQASSPFLHFPVFQTGCSVCHDPHASDVSGRLYAGVNDLCLACHAMDAQGEPGSSAQELVLFGGAVRLPGNYLEKVGRIPVAMGAKTGHPMQMHPIDGANASSGHGKLSCISCHNAHAGKGNPRMFVTGSKTSSSLCLHCHK